MLYAIHSYPQWVPVEREKKANPIGNGSEMRYGTAWPTHVPRKKDMSTRTRSDIVSSCDFYIFLEKYGTFQLCVGNISPLVCVEKFIFLLFPGCCTNTQRSQNTLYSFLSPVCGCRQFGTVLHIPTSSCLQTMSRCVCDYIRYVGLSP